LPTIRIFPVCEFINTHFIKLYFTSLIDVPGLVHALRKSQGLLKHNICVAYLAALLKIMMVLQISIYILTVIFYANGINDCFL
jgi:hypothetical protein